MWWKEGLLWVVGLAASLALAAAGFAFASREGRGWARLPFPLLACLLPAGLSAVLLVWTWRLARGGGPDWFPAVAAWTSAYTAGLAILHLRGRARPESRGTRPAVVSGLLLLAAAAVLGVGFLGTIAWVDAGATEEFRELHAEASAAVQALSPPVPEAENAAPVYEQAFALLGRERLQVNGAEPLPDDAARQVDAFLADKAAAIALFERAAGMPRCRSVEANDASASMWFAGSDLLSLKARREAARGRTREAFRALELLGGMAKHAGEDGQPFVACGMVVLARKAAEHVIAAGGDGLAAAPLPVPEPSFAPLLANAFRLARARDLTSTAELALHEDACNRVFSAEDFTHAGSPGAFVHDARRRLFRAAIALRELRETDRARSRLDGLAGSPPLEQRRVIDGWTRELANPRAGWLGNLLLSAWADGLNTAARAEANAACTALALAAAAFRAARGSYPRDAAELVPRFLARAPLDPFSGQPLRLLPQEGGLIIYSVGPNGMDDGGAELDLARQAGDLTFVLGSAYVARRQPLGEAVRAWSDEGAAR